MTTKTYLLDRDHLLAFGAIIQQFARFERLIETTVSSLLGSKHTLVAMVMSGLGYRAKYDSLSALLAVVVLSDEEIEAIKGHLKKIDEFNSLRNSIAHQAWKEGMRRGAVKPISVSVRSGKAKFVGLADDERDYTADELCAISDELNARCTAFRDFLFTSKIVSTGDEDTASPTAGA